MRAKGVPPLGTTGMTCGRARLANLAIVATRRGRVLGESESRDIATTITPAAVAPGGSYPYTRSWDWDQTTGRVGSQSQPSGTGREPEEAT